MSISLKALSGIAASCVLMAACATQGGPVERKQARLAQVQSLAGDPVDSIRYFTVDAWEPLGEHHLLIETSPREAWLLEVHAPCSELRWAKSVRVLGSNNRLDTTFGRIMVRNQVCQIKQIQPVDSAQLRRAGRPG